MFSPDIQREVEFAASAEADLQRGWPEAIPLRLFRQSMWYELCFAFLPAFPSVNALSLRPLALFGRLFASSIFVHDPLADRDVVAKDSATSTLRIMAMQFEAYRALHASFSPEAVFWSRLRGYLADYADACMEELRVCSGARPWQAYSEELALDVAIRKSGPSRAIIAGLAELARDDSLLEPLVDALNQFNIACQMWDDLKDWKEDLQHGMPSLLLTRVLPEHPSKGDAGREPDRVARELYYGGHAGYVLDLALAALDTAERVKASVPRLPWYQLIEITRRKLEATQRDVKSIIERNVQRVCTQRSILRSEPPR